MFIHIIVTAADGNRNKENFLLLNYTKNSNMHVKKWIHNKEAAFGPIFMQIKENVVEWETLSRNSPAYNL